MKKIVIIGATSAIAHETAKLFAAEGASLFLVGRNAGKLDAVAADLRVRQAARVDTFVLDMNDLARHAELWAAAREAFGAIDAILVAHGQLPDQPLCERSPEEAINAFTTNCLSIVSLLTLVAQDFEQQRSGCIAVISSVAGDRGRQSNYVYGAAKGGVSLFLQGLRNRLFKAGVSVVTIKPGFVDTPMTAGLPKNFLYSSAATVAGRIHRAMQDGDDVVYVPVFWHAIMGVIRLLPERVFKRMRL